MYGWSFFLIEGSLRASLQSEKSAMILLSSQSSSTLSSISNVFIRNPVEVLVSNSGTHSLFHKEPVYKELA